jgi:hypothetical protein
MNIKEWVFDRISSSLTIFKNNFKELFIPFFVYNFISITIVWTIAQYYFVNSLASIDDYNNLDTFSFLNNSAVVTSMAIWMFLFILYLIVYVYVLLSLMESIKQALKWEKINMTKNLIYWFENFWNSMKTYWHIFVYIAMIPSLLFILWWIMFNLSYYLDTLPLLASIWWWLMIISALIFIVFSIYRWTKSKFALYSAVNSDEYTKENFLRSVKYTDWNWWRIVWNFILAWILVSLVGYIISAINWLISFWLWWGSDLMSWLSEAFYNKDFSNIKDIVTVYLNDFSFTAEILWNIFDTFYKTIWNVFLIIFSYLLYLRLWIEYVNNNWWNTSIENKTNEKVEL